MCTPPAYSCGRWLGAAEEAGVLVCPTGNAPCADSPALPTWEEPFAKIDEDLEAALARVETRYPRSWTRHGAILTGYCGGLCCRHHCPAASGALALLILNEADVELTLPTLKAARIRAVALIAGEWGDQIAGERERGRVGGAAHPSSGDAQNRPSLFRNIDDIMRDAIAFVVSHEQDR